MRNPKQILAFTIFCQRTAEQFLLETEKLLILSSIVTRYYVVLECLNLNGTQHSILHIELLTWESKVPPTLTLLFLCNSDSNAD
jgi:hypothetical protein